MARVVLIHLLLTLFLISETSCTYLPQHTRTDVAPGKVPNIPLNYYDYPKQGIEASVVSESQKRKYTLKRIEFPLSLPLELEVSDKEELTRLIEAEKEIDVKHAENMELSFLNRLSLYVPHKSTSHPRPLIVISPILGGNQLIDQFAEHYAKKGYVSAIVHRQKMEWDDEEDLMQVEKYLRTSVIRIRQALDWLVEEPEVDASKVGTFAMSYGAILHSVLAAVEPRVHKHILIMPGGPLAEIITNCPENSIRSIRNHVRQKYRWSDKELEAELRRVIKTDPILFAGQVPTQNIQYYISLFDRVVGSRNEFELWRAMGKPALKFLPLGHYGSMAFFPLLERQTYQTFQRYFETKEGAL